MITRRTAKNRCESVLKEAFCEKHAIRITADSILCPSFSQLAKANPACAAEKVEKI